MVNPKRRISSNKLSPNPTLSREIEIEEGIILPGRSGRVFPIKKACASIAVYPGVACAYFTISDDFTGTMFL